MSTLDRCENLELSLASIQPDHPAIAAKAARKTLAKHGGDLAQVDGLTMNEAGIKNPLIAAAKSVACILSSDKALIDPNYQLKYVNLIAERCQSAHQDFIIGAVQVLMSQVVVLEAIITKHSALLAVADSNEDQSTSLEIIFRAHNEIRKTLLAIDQIKNPKKPTQFIKTFVAQQLNQLKTDLRGSSYETNALPTGERPEAITANSRLEAVGEFDRATLSGRQSKSRRKRQ